MSSIPEVPTPNMLADGPLLRPEEGREPAAVKTSWIYDSVRSGRLPCIRVGRHIRFTRHMLPRVARRAGGALASILRPP
jgi:hypothetical protein